MSLRPLLLALVLVTGCVARADDGDDPPADPPADDPPATPEDPPAGPVLGAPSGDVGAGAEACGAISGSCVAISSCSSALGHITDVSCQSNAGVVCCVTPADSCGGLEDFMCCSGSTVMRPVCLGGTELGCRSGQTRATNGTCP
jgi:hypothetical protein